MVSEWIVGNSWMTTNFFLWSCFGIPAQDSGWWKFGFSIRIKQIMDFYIVIKIFTKLIKILFYAFYLKIVDYLLLIMRYWVQFELALFVIPNTVISQYLFKGNIIIVYCLFKYSYVHKELLVGKAAKEPQSATVISPLGKFVKECSVNCWSHIV